LKKLESGGLQMKMGKLLKCYSIVISLVIIFGIGEALAATYYVSPTGNDSNSGLIGAPFKTIQRAADIVNPGDTVVVKNGIYTDTNGDNSIVKLRRGGTAANWITFRS
jgi:signal peptidase I